MPFYKPLIDHILYFPVKLTVRAEFTVLKQCLVITTGDQR